MKPSPISAINPKFHEQITYQLGHAKFTPYSSNPGVRARPQFQEREATHEGKTDNPPRQTEMDGEGRPLYRITITLRTSDNRDRDADGAISTLLDTYLFALGRLLNVDRGALRKLAKSEERRRGL